MFAQTGELKRIHQHFYQWSQHRIPG